EQPAVFQLPHFYRTLRTARRISSRSFHCAPARKQVTKRNRYPITNAEVVPSLFLRTKTLLGRKEPQMSVADVFKHLLRTFRVGVRLTGFDELDLEPELLDLLVLCERLVDERAVRRLHLRVVRVVDGLVVGLRDSRGALRVDLDVARVRRQRDAEPLAVRLDVVGREPLDRRERAGRRVRQAG